MACFFLFQGEKFLVLKRKYRECSLDLTSPTLSASELSSFPAFTPDLSTPVSPLREPPPYRPPPPATPSPSHSSSSLSSYSARNVVEDSPIHKSAFNATEEEEKKQEMCETDAQVTSPPVPPRRKSQGSLRVENKENIAERTKTPMEGQAKASFILEFVTINNNYLPICFYVSLFKWKKPNNTHLAC